MDRIRSLVALARNRLLLQEWIRASWTVAAVTVAIVLLVIIERRTIGASAALGVPSRSAMWLVASIALGCGLAAVIGWLRVRALRQTFEQVALEVDARIHSGERLSTALALAADSSAADDAFARAAIADAVVFAGDPDLPGRIREVFPVRLVGRWWVAPLLLVAVIASWWAIPQRIAAEAVAKGPDAALAAERPKSPEEKRLEELLKNIEQTPETLARTVVAAARHVRRFGVEPKIALCSGSQFGNLDCTSGRVMRGALGSLDSQSLDFEYEGEMHTDAALDPALRERLLPGNRLSGRANVLVYANTDAAGAARNLLKSVGGGLEVGPILMGMGNRAHIVTPGVTPRGLLNIAALGSAEVSSYG